MGRVTLTLLFCIVVLLTLLPAFVTVAHAQGEPTLSLYPPTGVAGGDLRFAGYNLPLGQSVRLLLVAEVEVNLGNFTTGRKGVIQPTTVLLPEELPSGNYQLLLLAQDDGSIVDQPFLIMDRPILTLQPNSGPPGTNVSFTITGLRPGMVQFVYAGHTLLPPVTVSESTYSGTFIVPALGDMTDAQDIVQALNEANGLRLGVAEAAFNYQTPPAQPFSMADLTLSNTQLAAGERFQISGRVVAAPDFSLEDVELQAMWQSADGQRTPLIHDAPVIEINGAFVIDAFAPSLYAGSPLTVQSGASVDVVVTTPGAPVLTFKLPDIQPPGGTPLVIQAIAEETKEVIEGAKVRVIRLDDQQQFTKWADPIVMQGNNQLAATLPGATDYQLTDEEKAAIFGQQLLCTLLWPKQVKPDLDPTKKNYAIDPTLEDFYVIPMLSSHLEQAAVPLQNGLPAASSAAKLSEGPTIPYRVFIDAVAQGYGEEIFSDSGLSRKGLPVWLDLTYHIDEYVYTEGGDGSGKPLSNPLLVPLKKLSSAASTSLGTVQLTFEGLPPDVTEGGLFVAYYSLAGLPADVQSPASTSVEVELTLDRAQYHKLTDNDMRLKIDETIIGSFEFSFDTGINCDGPDETSHYDGRLTLDNPHLLAAGTHQVMLLADVIGASLPYNPAYQLEVRSLPDWFVSDRYHSRKVIWTPGGTTISATRYSAAQDAQSLSAKPDDTMFGEVDFQSGMNLAVEQTLQAHGSGGSVVSGSSDVVSWNEKMDVLNYASNSTKEVKAGDDDGKSGEVVIQLPKIFETSVPRTSNDNKIVVGIPKFAEVAFGIRSFYEASLDIFAQVFIKQAGAEPDYQLVVYPWVLAGVDAYGDVTVLLDIVADAQVHMIPQITADVPVNFSTQKILDVGACFSYRVDMTWHGSIGCIPRECALGVCIGGYCAYEASGIENIIKPNSAKLADLAPSFTCNPPGPPAAASAIVAAAVDDPPLHSARPTIASDGFGNRLLLWRNETHQVMGTHDAGWGWQEPVPVSWESPGMAPSVAFYAPNHAVAVWTTNAIPLDTEPTLSLDEAVMQQHMAYALWNGTSWSQPLNLTLPSGGEGGAVLASCMSTKQGCPEGGEVTAAWVRKSSGSFIEHRFQIMTATFRNGAWSEPEVVEPNTTENGDVADGQPMATYHNGTPYIGWVRDTDRSFTTAGDRHIWLRPLDGVSSAAALAQLPPNVISGSLASKSNGELVLAFTVSPLGALIGPTGELHMSTGQCQSSSCAWQTRKLLDVHGRSLLAERPVATVADGDEVSVVFRGLGFGPDGDGKTFVLPSDSTGMTEMTGALVQVVDNGTEIVTPNYVEADGINWQTAAAYDPLTAQTFTVSAINKDPLSTRSVEMDRSDALQANHGIAVTQKLKAPDFVVHVNGPASENPATDATQQISLTITNQGHQWRSQGEASLTVQTSWQGATDHTASAGSIVIDDWDGVGSVKRSISVTPPPASHLQEHHLIVRVNPNGAIVEQDLTNNASSVKMGGLPFPNELNATTTPDTPLVFLTWTPVDHPSVTGYRIYRTRDDGAMQPVGSSFGTGWVDVTAEYETTYLYAVAAHSLTGIESELSVQAAITTGAEADDPEPDDPEPPTFWRIFLPMIR